MMHYRIAHACAALAATVALAAATPSFAQGRDKAGPKTMSAPQPMTEAAMMPPAPPPPPPAPMEPGTAAMPPASDYPACTATVRDHCIERALMMTKRARHYPR